MKKLLMLAAVLVGFSAISRAATPLTQAGQVNQGPYSNTSIYVSTYPPSGQPGIATFAAVTKTSTGGTTVSCRNCLTKLVLQLGTGTTFYLLDGAIAGGTTMYTIYGQALSNNVAPATVNTMTMSWDSLAPLCGTAGNAMNFYFPAPGVALVNQAVSADGYTYCGYANNAGN